MLVAHGWWLLSDALSPAERKTVLSVLGKDNLDLMRQHAEDAVAEGTGLYVIGELRLVTVVGACSLVWC